MARTNAQPAADPEGPLAEAREKWLPRLDSENKAHKPFRELAKDANAEFYAVSQSDDGDTVKDKKVIYPLFWSIVNVLHGKIFSQPPTPDVRKRNQDESAQQPLIPPSAQAYPAADGILAGLPPGAQGGNPIPAGATQPGQQPPGMGPPVGGMPAQAPQPPIADDNKIAQTLERAIQYVIDTTTFDADSHAAVNDFLVTSLGVAKVEIDL